MKHTDHTGLDANLEGDIAFVTAIAACAVGQGGIRLGPETAQDIISAMARLKTALRARLKQEQS